MKKFLLGCLVFVVLAAVGLSVAGYFFVYAPIRDFANKMDEVARLDEQIENKSSHSPPSDNLLTQDQVSRFVKVQRSFQERLGDDYQGFRAKIEEIDQRKKAGGGDPGIMEMARLVGDFVGLVTGAKRAQVDALNANGFSLKEYEWVREKSWEAMGASFAYMDLEKIAEAARNGELGDVTGTSEEVRSSAPPENVALLKPYANEFENWAPVAWLGF